MDGANAMLEGAGYTCFAVQPVTTQIPQSELLKATPAASFTIELFPKIGYTYGHRQNYRKTQESKLTEGFPVFL